ncbi:o-succinylbenzoate synthase [Acaryochloris sp. 'Moss Beach']|uniref:o-succinylbenzoate synthase n=1 Tax=Acaryochloris sp. 'Moss Beach' TaxID=2740837 RepID=UPI001F2C7305|nr:o-succinylbenzoate synthase [Acaryochloris sp. 'Moss Beach']UJB68026.1 o-succinylbenzoate synthase [Acaryochloris sp. 'Moss Beach']
MQFSYQTYQRSFQQPLQTRYGRWSVRRGLIVTLEDDAGNIGQGEIAPLSWFGSETWEQAQDYCQQLPPQLTDTQILSIPDHYPACQFGLGSAWEALTQNSVSASVQPNICGLLPTGRQALSAVSKLWEQGYRTLKWKIGVEAPEQEQAIFQQLIGSLPQQALLRLDANGGLTDESACSWLHLCDQVAGQITIEYLEQPLSPEQFSAMLSLSQQFQTPLALDESVATLSQLHQCVQQGWNGIFVIKPAICGYPHRLRQFCQSHPIDAVFSSVFESEVGRQACLRLAAELSNPQRAIGFGVRHWLSPDE